MILKRRIVQWWTQLIPALRRLPADDRGYSAEAVIMTMVLTAIGLTVGSIFSDEIVAAARDIVFHD
ncbi:hypothetical protein [Streptomyces sp. NPDC127098]|uniref:hypothetical protein n=1 Tax=Streptomyces sp. NPDC127098 TaxID=3347137 RepID=UPI00365935B2